MGINSSKINIQNGGGLISGSTIINDLTGSLFGTASFAVLSTTSSYSSTSSYTLGTASYADSASVAVSASYAESASYAISSSYATNSSQSLTSFTASYVDITGSGVSVNYFGSQIQLTASAAETGLACYPTYTKYALNDPTFPIAGTYAGTTYNVASQSDFTTALTSAVTGDIISLTADIDLSSTLTINKSVKVVGNGFSIQTPATSNTITHAVDVTADNVYFDSTLTVKNRKTNADSNASAVRVNALNFVSEATIEFMEFGYILNGGTFNITGTTKYTGAAGNNHRHIAVYGMSANSIIDGVVFDFPQEATPRANLVTLLGTNTKTGILKVANTTMITATYCRQFFFVEGSGGILNLNLIIDNNIWDDLVGGIGFFGLGSNPLNKFGFLQITNNTQGASGAASYKGLVFLDNSTAAGDIGTTTLYYSDNTQAVTALRVDYTYTDTVGIAFRNDRYTNNIPLLTQTDCEVINNAFEYVASVPTASSSVSASYALTASYVNITGSGVLVNYNGSQIQLTASAGGASVSVSDTAPAVPADGDLWYNSANTTLNIYYNDGDSSQWVGTNNGLVTTASYATTADKLNTIWSKPLNNVAGPVSNWTTNFTGTGRNTLITATVATFRNPGNAIGTVNLLRDGVIVASTSLYYNISYHWTLPTLMYMAPNETGLHTYSISLGTGMGSDTNSFCTMTIQEF